MHFGKSSVPIAKTKEEMEANMRDILASRKAPGMRIRKTVENFKSPVDGSVITNQRELDAHNKKNDVIDCREWGNDQFCDLGAKKEREEFFAGTSTKAKKARTETIVESIQKLEQGWEKPPARYEDDPL